MIGRVTLALHMPTHHDSRLAAENMISAVKEYSIDFSEVNATNFLSHIAIWSDVDELSLQYIFLVWMLKSMVEILLVGYDDIEEQNKAAVIPGLP